ncbi:MAG: PEP-CTERM sorting domain-containing protein [Planctomycetaceae bacterium]|jgi:hypothetical protein|nr:PEP-CTERM sorting domain-containing protein [Planctomycetaceae bacterium]
MTKKIFSLILATSFISLSLLSQAKADLNAQEIVDRFNSASGGELLKFSSSGSNEAKVSQRSGYGFADTSAYATTTGTSTSYQSFCVEPTATTASNMTAELNYANGVSKTSQGFALSLGAAYLYKQFATGNLTGFDYVNTSTRSSNAATLRDALRTLVGISGYGTWSSNAYLLQLLTINSDQTYWTQNYDPNSYYNIIGDYSVFVMNCYTNDAGTSNGQDFLYLANATQQTPGTPEPATIFLWGLGSLGLYGFAARRRTKNKQMLQSA